VAKIPPAPPAAAPGPHVLKLAEGEKEEEFEYTFNGNNLSASCAVFALSIGSSLEKMKFVRIRQGTFTMGSPEKEKDLSLYTPRKDFEPLREDVKILNDFYLGQYEVTLAQYDLVMGTKLSKNRVGRLPVEMVTWDEATAFCTLLSRKTGRTIRLPNEQEWEYACRAGKDTPFHFGEKLDGELANCNGKFPFPPGKEGEYHGRTKVVASYPANPWGLFDMHGNVAEWCDDTGATKLIRGGSWFQPATQCRAAVRYGKRRDHRFTWIGFRVAMMLN